LDNVEGLEDFEIEEAIERLGKVNPADWPRPEEIQIVDAEELLRVYDEDASLLDFMEAPATTSEKVEKAIRHTIESVFGDKVDKIRSAKGDFPNEENQHLQTEGGSFEGTFEYQGKKFEFTLEPDESGWTLQYRITAKSLDELPPTPPDAVKSSKEDEKKSHARGWR
jgi:hypothetical protein